MNGAPGELAGVPGTTLAMKPLRYMNQVQKGNVENPNAWDAVGSSLVGFILRFLVFAPLVCDF